MQIILQPKTDYNPEKLCGEITKIAESCTIYHNEDDYSVEWEGASEEQVRAVIAAHDPTPEPEPLSDIEQTQLAVAEAIEKQEADKVELQLALAEAIEMLAGGGE